MSERKQKPRTKLLVRSRCQRFLTSSFCLMCIRFISSTVCSCLCKMRHGIVLGPVGRVRLECAGMCWCLVNYSVGERSYATPSRTFTQRKGAWPANIPSNSDDLVTGSAATGRWLHFFWASCVIKSKFKSGLYLKLIWCSCKPLISMTMIWLTRSWRVT